MLDVLMSLVSMGWPVAIAMAVVMVWAAAEKSVKNSHNQQVFKQP